MKKISSLLFIFLVTGQVTMAQVSLWTFQQCLDTALNNNISVNQSRLSNEVNKIALEQTKASRIPSLSANANEGLNFGKNVDPTTNAFVTQSYNSTNFSLNTGLNLFNGLQTTNTIRQNRLNVDAGTYDIEKVKNDVTLNITTAYLQLLFAYEILSTAKSQADGTLAQVDRTIKLVNAGKVPESNLYQIRSQSATDNLSVVNAQSQLDMAKVNLMQVMEIPITDSFDIEKPELVEPSEVVLLNNYDIYQKALTVQPQIAGATTRTSSALMGIKVSQGARYPKLNLSAGMNTNYASSRKKGSNVNPEGYPFGEQLWDNLGQTFGLGLSIPIYSNRQIKSNIDRAKINAMNVQLNEKNVKNQLRKSIEQTYTDLKSALKKYEATKEQLSAAESSYSNMTTKYNVGLSNAIDFLVEKNNYFNAQSNLIQAKYDYIFKTKILNFYQGQAIKF